MEAERKKDAAAEEARQPHTRACEQELAMSWPKVGEAGETGDWRTVRPVLDTSKCLAAQRGKLACMQCWMFCPDAVITRTVPPGVNMTYCKGCGICVEVCPAGAITLEPEHEHEEEHGRDAHAAEEQGSADGDDQP